VDVLLNADRAQGGVDLLLYKSTILIVTRLERAYVFQIESDKECKLTTLVRMVHAYAVHYR
jgi:hypothetical protein